MELIKETKNKEFKVIAVCKSKKKGISKEIAEQINLIKDLGVEGDAHAEGGIRQVSLLAWERIEELNKKGFNFKPGDFAENITTTGVNLSKLKVGTKLKAGEESILEISQIGKVCHTKCAIFKKVGDCIMPSEGVFAKVIKGGKIIPQMVIEC